MSRRKIRTVIISRTDAIGDVVLTLPVASLLKDLFGKELQVIFFGRKYTYPVISACDSVDRFINYDTFSAFDSAGQVEFLKDCKADAIIHVFPRSDIAKAAKGAGIPIRIGTTNRLFHWYNCNRLVRLSRKNSSLHESQLNIKLLKPFGHSGKISLNDIPFHYHLNKIISLPEKFIASLSGNKFRLVIHPKSHSSAREWSLDNYRDLIRFLPSEKFQFIITGGEKEVPLLNDWEQSLPSNVINFAGKLSLDELIALINSCNGIVAASTGPLHIGAALGKFALGLFPPIVPMHSARWGPVGENAHSIAVNKKCSDCRFSPAQCHCMNEISPHLVEDRILKWIK